MNQLKNTKYNKRKSIVFLQNNIPLLLLLKDRVYGSCKKAVGQGDDIIAVLVQSVGRAVTTRKQQLQK